jgi:hypothetical protein
MGCEVRQRFRVEFPNRKTVSRLPEQSASHHDHHDPCQQLFHVSRIDSQRYRKLEGAKKWKNVLKIGKNVVSLW